jgi:hypothetical protein
VSPWRRKSARRGRRVAWGLDARRLAWHSGLPDEAAARCAPHADGLPAALAHLPRGASVDIIAGNDLAVHWLQAPPASARSLDELRMVAAVRCAHLHGGAPRDWWVAADWNATRHFACAALPEVVASPVREALAARGVRVNWHTAWGLACSSRANEFPSEGWSALRSPTGVLLWHCRRGRADCIASFQLSPDAGDAHAAKQALQQVALERLRDASLTDGAIHWLLAASAAGARNCEAEVALGWGDLLAGAAA